MKFMRFLCYEPNSQRIQMFFKFMMNANSQNAVLVFCVSSIFSYLLLKNVNGNDEVTHTEKTTTEK